MISSHSNRLPRQHFLRAIAVMIVLLLATFSAMATFASPRIKHTIKKQYKVSPSMGRELYFALPQNYEDQGGKYFYLYVTSPKQTTIHVETSMGTLVQSISPYKVAAFNIPLGWEIKSNNIVEDKGIRVYSRDADVTGYLMSHNPYTSDGMYVFPTIGWGTDYVVAAFAGLDAGGADYPAEFVVVANQNNTQVEITPSCNLRTGGNGGVVGHAKGQKFSVTLNKGQAIQYKSTNGGGADEQDVTGTIVHASAPVGVIGASQCPDIPLGYPYCDHVLDMMPPTRTWAKTYYTAPSFQRLKGDTFLAITTVPGQKIMRQGSISGDRQEVLGGPQYDIYWVNDIDEGSKWYSDQPFFLTQYLNSSTWDCSSCGFGDPAEVVVNPVEQYSKTVVFQTPTSQGSQSPYTNYVNLIVNKKAASGTKFDGQSITNYTKITVDNIYEIYRAANIKPGTHIVTSDSGVGVYIYGYGSYESYAWTGAFGTGTYGSPDTTAPQAYTSGDCFDAHVVLTDTEYLATHINQIRVDSAYNMAFLLDPAYAEGVGMPISFYDMFVLDSTKEAYLQTSTFDVAGNATTVTSIYTPQVAIDSPGVISFGTGNINVGPAIENYLYITNVGKVPFAIGSLSLVLGNQGFTIDSADKSPLAVGEVRKIRIGFIPNKQSTVSDTLVFGDECIKQTAILIGSGGAPDFAVTDDHWGNVLAGSSTQNTQVHIINLSSKNSITITKITTDDPTFVYDETVPFTLAPSENRPLKFTYNASAGPGLHATHGHFTSVEAGTKADSLDAFVTAPSQSFHQDTTVTVDCAQPGDTVHLQFYVASEGNANSKIQNWSHSANSNPNFVNFHAEFQGGIVNAPFTLQPNSKLYILEDFVVPLNTSSTTTDQITAFDADGLPIKTVTATISTSYRTQNLLDNAVDFGTQKYMGSVVTGTVRLVNTTQDDLTVSSASLLPGGPDNASFSVQGVQIKRGATVINTSIPTTLKYLDTLIATVAFDPSVTVKAAQQARFGFVTNGCNFPPPVVMTAAETSSGAAIAGYNAPVISVCAQRTDNVTVTNPQAAGITDTIVGYTITGPDAANYSMPNVTGTTIAGTKQSIIPVSFAPNGAKTYSATITVYIANNLGGRDTVVQTITNTAAVAAATSTSTFAVSDQTATTGTIVKLPIDFKLTKNGIVDPLTINGVRFTYTFNRDLLSVQGADPNNAAATQAAIGRAVANTPANWNLDLANSSINGNTLVLTFTTPGALDESINSFGDVTFKVTLPKADTMRNVTLASMDLLTNGAVVTGCATTEVKSGQFGLIYSCGEKTLQDLMNGNNSFASFITPATPNPSTGGNIKFVYATRGAAPVTLSIFDVLGNEVARVVDNVPHEAGIFEVNYNAKNLSSGTYTYRLSVHGVTSSKQLVITK